MAKQTSVFKAAVKAKLIQCALQAAAQNGYALAEQKPGGKMVVLRQGGTLIATRLKPSQFASLGFYIPKGAAPPYLDGIEAVLTATLSLADPAQATQARCWLIPASVIEDALAGLAPGKRHWLPVPSLVGSTQPWLVPFSLTDATTPAPSQPEPTSTPSEWDRFRSYLATALQVSSDRLVISVSLK